MYTALTFIVLVSVSIASGVPSTGNRLQKFQPSPITLDRTKVGVDLCPDCINEVVVVINVLMNAILDEGILQSCGDLCGFVANKTGSKILADMCDVACDAFGIDEFVKLLINLDIDPIYYCQILKMCPSKNH